MSSLFVFSREAFKPTVNVVGRKERLEESSYAFTEWNDGCERTGRKEDKIRKEEKFKRLSDVIITWAVVTFFQLHMSPSLESCGSPPRFTR